MKKLKENLCLIPAIAKFFNLAFFCLCDYRLIYQQYISRSFSIGLVLKVLKVDDDGRALRPWDMTAGYLLMTEIKAIIFLTSAWAHLFEYARNLWSPLSVIFLNSFVCVLKTYISRKAQLL